jgi:hypothetical protein
LPKETVVCGAIVTEETIVFVGLTVTCKASFDIFYLVTEGRTFIIPSIILVLTPESLVKRMSYTYLPGATLAEVAEFIAIVI